MTEPPWKRHPELSRWSSAWLEHPEREAWQRKLAELSRAERIAYFETQRPIPPAWMDVVAAIVDGDWDRDALEQMEQVGEETGLVDPDAWERAQSEG